MTTLNTMLKRCAGLTDTGDLNAWENEFIKSLLRQTKDGDDTRKLTEKQIDRLEQIHDKHFA